MGCEGVPEARASLRRVTPTYSHRVRFHEADAQGILFNSRYLELADIAMTEFLRELGWNYPDFVALGADPAVVRAEIDFKRPVRFDDVVDLYVECTHVGSSSFKLRTEFRCHDEEIALTELVYVNLDAATGKSAPLPEVVTEALRRLQG
jgi:acyl-CoA thioester hydrolase